ncbi:MAG TPA: hypothetical protein VNZ49_17345 [Bacteroidia bacterium]|jgi:hypothetical protein|nr:hypothetical protein [Bacteroidia bacterium]
MKKTLRLIAAILMAVSMIIITGCKKGQDGAPGTNGKDGSANVIARTFTVSTWQSSSSRWYTQLSFPELTSGNINSAAVQAYFGTVSNNWIAMPYTVVASTDYFWGYLATVNLVEIRWDYNGVGIGSDPNTYYGAPVQIKVVVIPPVLKRANPNINWNSYDEVKKKFNLKD